MDRREFLVSTGAAVAGSATAAASGMAATQSPGAPAVVRASRTVELAMPWRDDGKGYGDSARRLARRIENMTEGRFHIEIAAGASESGSAGLRHGSAHDLAAHHPALSYFAGLPGPHGLSAQDFADWLTVGGGQMLWDELAASADVKPLLAGHSGPNPPLWSSTSLSSLSDLATRKVYAPGLGAEIARALGADAVNLRPEIVATSLADGSLEIAEWGAFLASMAAGIPAHARYAIGTGFNSAGTALALHVDLGLWGTLTETDRAILESAALQEFHASCAEARAHDMIARRTAEARFGIRVVPFPADIADALKRVADATVAHLAAYDAVSIRIDQSYTAFRTATSRPWAAPPAGII